jgi:hypothetical protein
VPHLFEPAASGRSKCRGCGRTIARGEIRFGECLPNLFGEGEMTSWFHLPCAAYKRPQVFLEAVREASIPVPDREALERAAHSSLAFRRNQRIDGAERSPTAQARCRCCHEPIARGSWRIRIAYYEQGRFYPGGFVHIACREAYFEGHDVLDQVIHFSAPLTEEEREDLRRQYSASQRQSNGTGS